MKKLICLMAAVMLLFTACGNNDANDNMTNDGVVEDNNGIIEDKDNSGNSTAGDAVDDAKDGAGDVVDGAADAVDDAVGGVENAVDEMTGNDNKNDNNTNIIPTITTTNNRRGRPRLTYLIRGSYNE